MVVKIIACIIIIYSIITFIYTDLGAVVMSILMMFSNEPIVSNTNMEDKLWGTKKFKIMIRVISVLLLIAGIYMLTL
ncbi:hypothetical protein [Clostridium lacusfryxellense]|uniref:hypothetical protein n=1 Tax=Clostridium lacusfryxellense TaxID=205328 RepID=UPI001C0D0995|nr:hypothetical protein [Clostridium lacusfryxellense]MBU3112082.1 hypothetical protein [Clostridium lacusfryxellense]